MIRFFQYLYAAGMTALAFVIFGLGALVLALGGYPWILAFAYNRLRRQRWTQLLIHWSFRLYFAVLDRLGVLKAEFEGLEQLRKLDKQRFVLVANHPTLLDFVLLAAVLPKAVVLIKKQAWSNPFFSILVRQAGYIPFEEGAKLIEDCQTKLDEGFPLVIFPEGTRSTQTGLNPFNLGAAYIAVQTGCPILPAVITISHPILMKGWHWYQIPPKKILLKVRFFPALDPTSFTDQGKAPGRMAKGTIRHLEAFFTQALASNQDQGDAPATKQANNPCPNLSRTKTQ